VAADQLKASTEDKTFLITNFTRNIYPRHKTYVSWRCTYLIRNI